jgi:SpoVK/Ycf46/Vps4 family AAA+-type ATPase
MDSLNVKIFGKKTFSNLLEEIYNNQKKKEMQISALINELKPLIEDIGDATLIVPLIKEYIEIGVKNDEQLIKMATIIQRSMQTAVSSGDGYTISDEEKAQLLAEIDKLNKSNSEDK